MPRVASALLPLLLALPLSAQDRAPVILQLPASTRALGMADAFPIGGSDSDAIFYNPAMSAQNMAGITVSGQRWGSGATMLTASGATEWWDGRASIGVMTLHYDLPLSRTAGDFDESVLLNSGPVQYSEIVAALGYARRIRGVRLALTGKAIQEQREVDRETTVAFDVSGGHVFGPIGVGVAVQNIGQTADIGIIEADSPIRVTLAAAATRAAPVGPLDVLPAVSVTRLSDGTIVPAAGVEVGYWPIQGRTFIARAGVRAPPGDDTRPFTIGAGFMGDRIALDWAWVPFEDGSAHRISIRWR